MSPNRYATLLSTVLPLALLQPASAQQSADPTATQPIIKAEPGKTSIKSFDHGSFFDGRTTTTPATCEGSYTRAHSWGGAPFQSVSYKMNGTEVDFEATIDGKKTTMHHDIKRDFAIVNGLLAMPSSPAYIQAQRVHASVTGMCAATRRGECPPPP